MGDTKPNVPLFDLTRQWQEIRKDVHEAINRVFATQQFIMGPQVKVFEQAISEYCGVSHAIGVASGSDALLLSLMALTHRRRDPTAWR